MISALVSGSGGPSLSLHDSLFCVLLFLGSTLTLPKTS